MECDLKNSKHHEIKLKKLINSPSELVESAYDRILHESSELFIMGDDFDSIKIHMNVNLLLLKFEESQVKTINFSLNLNFKEDYFLAKSGSCLKAHAKWLRDFKYKIKTANSVQKSRSQKEIYHNLLRACAKQKSQLTVLNNLTDLSREIRLPNLLMPEFVLTVLIALLNTLRIIIKESKTAKMFTNEEYRRFLLQNTRRLLVDQKNGEETSTSESFAQQLLEKELTLSSPKLTLL
ncbi:hypothetical protein Ciccas_012696 [Cichlidogyrus casuarinus]|uniref:Uncharacterized protein n=1 Tax=Cichlidogyrus casuarinus TaxID=1844966 RepID=A0ABD2PSP0_9PLAT